MSRLVLDKLLLGHVKGGLELAGFLDPQVLSALCERFIPAYSQRHHPGLHPAAPWVSGDIENAPTFLPGMHIDVTLTGPSRTLIIDMKCHGQILRAHRDHKILSTGSRNRTYGYVIHGTHDPRQRGRGVEGMLFYARTTVDPPLRKTWIGTGHRSHVHTLDLDQDFTGIASRLDEIAGLIKVT